MEHVFHFEPLNKPQEEARKLYQKNDLIFLTGVAGTGKTYCAVALALADLNESKHKEHFYLARPAVEGEEKLGFLPGTAAEKLNPYLLPIYDCIDDLLGKESTARYRIDKMTEIIPLAFMRGRSLNRSVCLMDEGQNLTYKQMKMFLTRLGKGSKMIVMGDPTQLDIPEQRSGLMDAIEKMCEVPGVAHVHFDENAVVRHPLVVEVLKRL